LILQEAFSDDDLEDDARTRSILGVVILAVNPLSPSTITTLLGSDTKDVLPSLSPAKSLPILQEDSCHPVRPFHKSFLNFITDPTWYTNPRFHISPTDHHLQILMSCFGLIVVRFMTVDSGLPHPKTPQPSISNVNFLTLFGLLFFGYFIVINSISLPNIIR